MTKQAKLPEAEWSVIVKVDDVPAKGWAVQISPDDKEKLYLAKRLDVVSVGELAANISVTRESGHVFHVQGDFKGKITQNCVVTLEPVTTEISDEFEAWYADETRAVNFKRAQHEAQSKKEMLDVPMLEESDDPEPIVNGEIDVGDLVTQYVSLAIPAYPCKEGAVVEQSQKQPANESKSQMKLNPFAALKDWRPKD